VTGSKLCVYPVPAIPALRFSLLFHFQVAPVLLCFVPVSTASDWNTKMTFLLLLVCAKRKRKKIVIDWL
jgi:hypothetical protein